MTRDATARKNGEQERISGPDDRRSGLPCTGDRIAELSAAHGTPLWVYDAGRIRSHIESLRRFDVIRYMQKACSNIHILRLMRSEGVHVTVVSAGELDRALTAGYRVDGPDRPIVLTADLLDRPTLRTVVELGVPVNAGSPHMLSQIGRLAPGHPVWIRINPGFGHGPGRRTSAGGAQSKHGIWHEQLAENLALIDRYDLDLIGLHMHVGSSADHGHLAKVCDAMVKLVLAHQRPIHAISAGGGLPVPYQPGDPVADVDHCFRLWDTARREIAAAIGRPVRLEIEPGRYLVASSGALITEVRAHKPVGGNHFVLVDAGFNDLVRPAMYGSTHRVSAFGPDGLPRTGFARETVLAGALCESGDVFTQDPAHEVRPVSLPATDIGDLVVFHDAGAYGASMSSTYNSRPLAPEVLIDRGVPRLIRRRQTIEDLLALEM
ncbi:diaminopimelate decarboxylase [Nocardia sp. BMG111209]|uniref:diaminopimelate decarboxylase n=1 Tax=Nocardia sp. BMG111209 TaxID=1160137 RepID=UPI000379AD58|nr:diaminopimelate decarboxylase [Nocardia sp. BMG111209]